MLLLFLLPYIIFGSGKINFNNCFGHGLCPVKAHGGYIASIDSEKNIIQDKWCENIECVKENMCLFLETPAAAASCFYPNGAMFTSTENNPKSTTKTESDFHYLLTIIFTWIIAGFFNAFISVFVGVILYFVQLKAMNTRLCTYGGDNYIFAPGYFAIICVFFLCAGSSIGFVTSQILPLCDYSKSSLWE